MKKQCALQAAVAAAVAVEQTAAPLNDIIHKYGSNQNE